MSDRIAERDDEGRAARERRMSARGDARPTRAPAPFVLFAPADVEQSVPERFERLASSQPERLAVSGQDARLTYAELNGIANEIAHAILHWRGEASERVAMLVPPGTRPMGLALGIFKAGKVLVALDPK